MADFVPVINFGVLASLRKSVLLNCSSAAKLRRFSGRAVCSVSSAFIMRMIQSEIDVIINRATE